MQMVRDIYLFLRFQILNTHRHTHTGDSVLKTKTTTLELFRDIGWPLIWHIIQSATVMKFISLKHSGSYISGWSSMQIKPPLSSCYNAITEKATNTLTNDTLRIPIIKQYRFEDDRRGQYFIESLTQRKCESYSPKGYNIMTIWNTGNCCPRSLHPSPRRRDAV